MKRNKLWLAILTIFVALTMTMTACKPAEKPNPSTPVTQAQKTTPAPVPASDTSPEPATTPQASPASTTPASELAETSPAEPTKETVSYTDSVGRTVELPAEIKRVAPSGPLAQIVMYTAFPERLCGLARPFSETQTKLFGDAYKDMPAFGQFYGGKSGFNKEAVVAANTELMIDIGEAKGSMKEDMDKMMQEINIPTVFVEATLENLPQTYTELGKLFGDPERVKPLADYAAETIELAQKASAAVPEADRIKVYWAGGEHGLDTNAKGSFHAEVLNLLPVENVVDIEPSSKGGGTTVSMEQIMQWQPDVIIVDGKALYDELQNDPKWTALEAFQNERVYLVPDQPYHFLARPPSVNRLMGVRWLGSLLYPEHFDKPVVEAVQEFYKLFYHVELDNETAEAILAGSFK